MRTCAHYLGVAAHDLHHVAIEYQEFGDERHRDSLQNALEGAKALASELASDANHAHA